jgi:regulator of replication initiation timing
MMEYDTGKKVINFDKLSLLVEELFKLREEYEKSNKNVEELTEENVMLKLDISALKERIEATLEEIEAANLIRSSIAQLEEEVLAKDASIRSLNTEIVKFRI